MTLLNSDNTSKTVPARLGLGRRTPWVVLAIILLAAVAIGITITTSPGTVEPAASSETDTAVQTQSRPVFTEEEQLLMKLATTGYIPPQAVDWDLMGLKQAVADGDVPEQALQPSSGEGQAAVFTAKELTTIELARMGLIPMETVDWDEVERRGSASEAMFP